MINITNITNTNTIVATAFTGWGTTGRNGRRDLFANGAKVGHVYENNGKWSAVCGVRYLGSFAKKWEAKTAAKEAHDAA